MSSPVPRLAPLVLGTLAGIAFAAIVHMAQTVPRKRLRCGLESRDMVTVKTADGDCP